MSERLLGSRNDVTAVRGDERVSCGLRWWTTGESGRPYGVEATGPWGTERVLGRNLWSALREVRQALEGHGWLLAVAGARGDVRQSGMLMGSGSDRAYVLVPGEPADPERMVGLFEDAPVADALTVEAQDAAYDRILKAPQKPEEPPAAPEGRQQPPGPAQGPQDPPAAAQGPQDPPLPPPPYQPGTWLYSIDPMYDPAGNVPPFAVVGAWPVDGSGNPGAFRRNPDYRPSPMSLGLARPTDPVDAAVQLAATGHGPEEAVADALARATVYVPDEGTGDVSVYEDEQGRFVPVLTDPSHAPANVPGLRAVTGAQLARVLPAELVLKVNPGGAVSVRVPVSDVRARAGQGGQ
ncbi:type VII secretion system-associated protein [Streptomyces sp. NPDC053493]|uniref:type VII secretion system-associated protein n=1 Tax=Streptomyces sp. NPDC053493 TaxID=3365705 RepID=UPI0037D954FD